MTIRGAHAADTTPALEAVGVCRDVGRARVLDHVDLAVPRGGVTALVGPEGCGKTTLLRVFASLLAADAGRVAVLGVDPAQDPRGVRRRLGWVPAAGGVLEELTVREGLLALAGAHGMGPAAARPRIDELISSSGLGPDAGRRAGRLAPGAVRRLALAQALLHSPEVLLMDTHAAGRDPDEGDERDEAVEALGALLASGTTVLVAARESDALEGVAARSVVMESGRIVASHETGTRPGLLTWRIHTLDAERLRAVLREIGTDFDEVAGPPDEEGDGDGSPGRGVIDVGVADEADASALMQFLVTRSIPVVAFGPADPALRSTAAGVQW